MWLQVFWRTEGSCSNGLIQRLNNAEQQHLSSISWSGWNEHSLVVQGTMSTQRVKARPILHPIFNPQSFSLSNEMRSFLIDLNGNRIEPFPCEWWHEKWCYREWLYLKQLWCNISVSAIILSDVNLLCSWTPVDFVSDVKKCTVKTAEKICLLQIASLFISSHYR